MKICGGRFLRTVVGLCNVWHAGSVAPESRWVR